MSYLWSTSESTISPYSWAVAFMNCHRPAAPAPDRALGSRLLSMAIRYLRSSGMPWALSIGSTCAKIRFERLSIRVELVCV